MLEGREIRKAEKHVSGMIHRIYFNYAGRFYTMEEITLSKNQKVRNKLK